MIKIERSLKNHGILSYCDGRYYTSLILNMAH